MNSRLLVVSTLVAVFSGHTLLAEGSLRFHKWQDRRLRVAADEMICQLELFHGNTGEAETIFESGGSAVRVYHLPQEVDFPTRFEEGKPEEKWVQRTEGSYHIMSRIEDYDIRAMVRYRVAETMDEQLTKKRASVSVCQWMEIREKARDGEKGRLIEEVYSAKACRPKTEGTTFAEVDLNAQDPAFVASPGSTWRRAEFNTRPSTERMNNVTYNYWAEYAQLDSRQFTVLSLPHPGKRGQSIHMKCEPTGVVRF